jgi:hypothetical protein
MLESEIGVDGRERRVSTLTGGPDVRKSAVGGALERCQDPAISQKSRHARRQSCCARESAPALFRPYWCSGGPARKDGGRRTRQTRHPAVSRAECCWDGAAGFSERDAGRKGRRASVGGRKTMAPARMESFWMLPDAAGPQRLGRLSDHSAKHPRAGHWE